MKKVLSVVLAMVLMLSIMPTELFTITASAATSYTKDYYTYTVADGEATITDADTDISGDVVIPTELNGYLVTYVGDYAFSGCNKITSLTIPENIKRTGKASFKGCTGLTTVNFNAINCSSMCAVSTYPLVLAFEGCTRLKTVNIGENVTNIPGRAFAGCTGLTTVNFNAKNCTNSGAVNGLNLYAVFQDCSNLKTINIGEEVKRIPDGIFAYCTAITTVNTPESVISIGESAFSNCTNLTSVNIPEGVTTLTERVFSSCTSLSKIDIPNNVKKINDSAFYNCTSLKSVTIPEKVTSISYRAFGNCTSLTSVQFNAVNCTQMGSGNSPVFSGCSSFKTVNFGENVEKIPPYAFFECSSLLDVIIPDGITNIGKCAFEGCSALTSINIPDSVLSIGARAFVDCTGLQGVYIKDLKSWLKIDFATDYYYTAGSNPLYCAGKLYLNGELVTDLVIPEGTTAIKDYAFFNCTTLTSVILPDSLTSIGEDVFYGCTGLEYNIYDNAKYFGNDQNQYLALVSAINRNITDITLHQNTQIICDYAFKGCTTLSNITIPVNVTHIGDYAFSDCSGLTKVSIPNSVKSIDTSAFYGCSNLKCVHIDDLKKWCEIDFVDVYSNPLYYACKIYLNDQVLTELIIPESVETIGEYVFYNCTYLTSVSIPDSVKSIGGYAFCGCSNLKGVYIDDLKKWCEIDFANDRSNPLCYAENLYVNGELLSELVIPNGTTAIKGCAFYNCTALTSVVLPDSLTSIGEDAFCGCSNLKGVYIDDLKKWCEIDFAVSYSNPLFYAENLYVNGELLSELVIPEEVTTINSFVFFGSNGIKSVTIHNGITSIGESAFSGCDFEKLYITDLAAWCNIDFGNAFANPLYYSEYLYLNGHKTTDIIIPDGVKNIKFATFYGYTNMTSLTIPSSVTNIGQSAFIYCYNIEKVHIADIAAWCNIVFPYYYASPFYSSPNAKLYLNGQETTQLVIPNGVKEIKSYAFYNCDVLESITIPISLTNINYYAFDSCDYLKTVYYQGNATEKSKISFGDSYVLNDATWYYNACIFCADHTYLDLECTVCKQNFGQITFINDGGVVYKETRVPLGLSYKFTTETPSKSGYNFAGWSYSENGDVAYVIGDTLNVRNSMTLYAQWNKLCPRCGGDKKYDCSNCSGKGKVVSGSCSSCGGDGLIYIGSSAQKLCGACNASGKTYKTCSYCSGNGYHKCSTCNANGEVIRKNVSAPNVPVWESVNSTTVVLQTITNGEYSIDGINWQEDPIFDNLEAGQEYSFYQRYAKTDTTYTSASSSALILLAHQHTFDNACDSLCNFCEYTRTVPDHVFDNGCDTACNVCGEIRTTTHIYDNNCDTICNECGLEREVPDHIYDNGCDAACNECGVERSVPDHIYDNACDTNCNECGLKRSVPDHIYDNVCDQDCNECHLTREVGPHFVGEGVPHILSNSQTYPFTFEDDWYNSTNKAHSSSSTFTLAAKHNCTIVVEYKVSSQRTYDKLIIKKNSSILVNASGSVSATEITIALIEGDILTLTYSKDWISTSGTDTAAFRFVGDFCSINADELEADCLNAVVCSGCGITIKPVSTEHTYDHACDTTCNICDFIRNVPEHSYILNGNHTCDICMFSKTPDAPVIENKTNNSITLSATEGFEYSKDGVTWQDSNVFSNLSANTSYTFYQRVKTSTTAFASEISEGTAVTFKFSQTTPSAPIISSFTDTTVTLIPNVNYEYSKDGTNWQTSNVFINLSANTAYTFYQRYAETNTHEASNKSTGTSVTTDKSKQTLVPNAPTVQSFTSNSITLAPVDGCEYSKNGTTWQTSNVFSGLSCGTEYSFYQRYKETNTTYVGKSSTVLVAKTDKGTQTVPSAPTLLSKSYNSITLTEINGYEYSCDGINWQTSSVFTGLNPETNYLFYQRVAENEKYYVSPTSSALIVKTNEQPIYTPGNINDDEAVDLTDVVVLSQAVAGWDTECNINALDVNGDGSVDLQDVTHLAQYVAGWEGVVLH